MRKVKNISSPLAPYWQTKNIYGNSLTYWVAENFLVLIKARWPLNSWYSMTVYDILMTYTSVLILEIFCDFYNFYVKYQYFSIY